MSTHSNKITPKMERIINETADKLGAIGIVGGLVPHSDILIIAAAWIEMIGKLANESNLELDDHKKKKLALALAKSTGTGYLGVKTISSVASWITGPLTGGLSLAFGSAANSAANYYLTKDVGYKVANIFTQDLKDTDIAKAVMYAVASKVGADIFEDLTKGDVEKMEKAAKKSGIVIKTDNDRDLGL